MGGKLLCLLVEKDLQFQLGVHVIVAHVFEQANATWVSKSTWSFLKASDLEETCGDTSMNDIKSRRVTGDGRSACTPGRTTLPFIFSGQALNEIITNRSIYVALYTLTAALIIF